MSLPRTTRLKLAILITTILMAVVAVLLVAIPNGVFAAAPERPTDLTATAVDHDTINLSWNHPDPASVDHYLILNRREGFGDGQLTQVGTSTTTSFVHDGLEPESTYFYRVKPVSAEGEEGQRSPRAEATTPAEATTEPEPTPERPTDLTATAVDHDTINLSWNHPDPASVDHYQVLSRREGTGTGLTQVGTSTTTSFAHDGLEPESTYFYRVKPVNAEGEEGQRSPRAEATTPAEATTEPDPTPAPPQQSDATTRTSHHVLVSNLGQSSQTRTGTTDSWSMPFTTGPDPRGYPVASVVIKYYSDNAFDVSVCTVDADDHPTSTCTALDPPSNFRRGNLTFTAPADTTLDPNTTYALFLDSSAQLVTLNLTGSNEDSGGAPGWSIGDNYANVYNGVWTDRGSALLIGINGSESYTAPDAPRWRIVHAKGETEISLSWAAPDNHDGAAITGYKIEISPNGISDWSNLVRDTKSSSLRAYTHTGLSAGTTRFYRVSAINSVDAGTASNAAGATTAAPNVLVSNTGQYADPEDVVGIGDQDKTNSQGFDTGTYSGQYSLDSVGVYVHDQSPSTGETLKVHIYTNRGGGPNTLKYTLTSPASYTSRAVNTFTAPHGATLDANKSYHVVFEANGDSATDFVLGAVESNSQDVSARTAWDIENAYRFNGTLTNTRNSFQISVNGRPIGVPVPETWGLIPNGLSIGDEFRLLFLSSTKQNANQAGINPYDSFIQRRANAGHDDIKQYKSRFRAIGCTLSTHANIHTGTLYTTSAKGLPIYWLNGNKVVDDYEDFYDGSWDDEDNNKNELGANGLDTSDPDNYPLTGCEHDGTPGDNRLGTNTPAVGVPNSSVEGDGPLSSGTTTTRVANHPMYGLSPIFRIVDVGDATLASLAIEGATGGESITLSPAFDADTFTYTASVPTDIEAVTLTAYANDSKAMVVMSNDDDTGTQNEADLNLGYGDNNLTVTVTAVDTSTTQSYTITVTRAAPPATEVPLNWSLVPTGLNTGDQFRLIFLSSTKRNATLTAIDDYNTFVQNLAAAGHTDIRPYSDEFTVVGCTSTFDARNNTATTYTPTNKGVPIYWLDGNKVANEYQDFYDGGWDDEANAKNELGNNGLDASQEANFPFTGCSDDGTEKFVAGNSKALGTTSITVGVLDASNPNYGPISSDNSVSSSTNRPMYGLSAVFQVAEYSLVPDTWSLKPSGLGVGDEFRLIFLSSTKRNSTSSSIGTYNTWIQAQAAAGHDDIQAYSDGFTVVGCTAAKDARDNTTTTYTSSDKGVPLYWLGGNKVADEYDDFYDGSWSNEANDKNELGANGPDTSNSNNYPVTGCGHDGTEKFLTVGGTPQSRSLGSNLGVTVARPNSSSTGHGPVSSGFQIVSGAARPMYGLSAIFRVIEAGDATLSDLAIEGTTGGETVNLTPTFDADTLTYTASVPYGTNTVTLTAATTDSEAMVVISNDDDTSSKNEANLDLDVGDTILTVTVTSQDAFDTKTYTITVTRAAVSTDATLNALTIEGTPDGQTVDLSPTFDAATLTLTYTAAVATEIDTVKLTATTTDSNATVVITDDDDTNSENEANLNLDIGDTTLTVTVTAQDSTTTLTYTITVTRAAPSNDATLSALTLTGPSGGKPATLYPDFDAEINDYTTWVANRIDAVKLTATKTDSNATIFITNDDDSNTPGEAQFNLNFAANAFEITVTAQDGLTTRTYNVNVNRATALPPAPTNCPADTNWCATMTVGYASQSLGETTKEEYWGYEANQIHGELTATTFVYGGATYTVTDLYRYKNFDTETNTVYGDFLDLVTSPGLPTGTVLQVDTRTFTTGTGSFTGTSGEEGWDIKDNPVNWRFSQNVTASLKLPPSMNATLQGLTLQGSTGGQAITLSPEFALGTTVYTASVVNRIDAVKLTATITDSNATVTITGDDDTNSKNEAKLNLIVGANTLTVTVTAADGNATQDYTITATRAAAPPAPTDCPADTTWCTTLVLGYSPIPTAGFTTETFGYLPSSNFGDLGSTTFSHGETSYTVSRIFRTSATNDSDGVVQSDNITLIFSPEIPDDTVFQIDTRTFTVDMDSEGASSGQEQWDLTADPPVWTAGQHVTVSLKFPSDDATLMALALTDTSDDSAITLTPQFEAPTESYAAPVVYNTDQITIVPTTTEPNATFGFLDRNDLEIADANSSKDDFQFNLAVLDNTVKVRVTAHDGITIKTYTVVVTRMDTTEPPLVTINADSPAVNYSPDDDATFTVTRASTFAVALTVNLHMTQNKLFLAAPHLARVVTIPIGSRSATLTITGAELQLVDSDPVETGTLTATVAPGTGYVIGSPASASVNIVPFMTVRIERVSYTVPEDVGTFAIKVIARTGNDAPQPASDFTVSLITQDGTAEQGQDYNLFDADITFQTGDFSRDGNAWKAEKTVMLTITDDLLDEPDQAFTLNLKRPNNLDYRILVVNSDNAAPRNQHQSTITIQDNDLAMPQVNFASSTYTVTEGNFVDIQVTLSEDPEQTVTIPLTVTNQGGTTSDDYSVQTSLTFTNNQTSMFTRFSALTDTADDDGESVIIAFGTIPTGLVAGTVTETVVSISNAEIRAETEIARLLSATQQHLLGCALFDSISLLGAGDTYRVNTDYARCVPLRDVYTDTCLSPDQTDHFDRQRITVFRELGLAVALMSMVDSARLLYSNTMLPTNNDGYASEAAQGFVRPNVIVALYPSLKRLYVNFAGTEDAYSIEDQAFEFADGQIYGPEMEFLLQRMQAIVDRNYYFPAPECRFDNDIRDRVKHPAGAEEDLGSIQTGVPRQGELDNGPDVDLFETTLIQGTTYVITAIPVDPNDVDLAKVNFQSLSTNKVVEQVQPRVQVMDTDGNELASGTEREPATYTATTGGTHHVRVTHANETDHKNAGIYILLLRTPDEFTGTTLSTLTLQDTTDGGNIILVPDFDPDTHSYIATAPNHITSVKLTATTTNVDVKATIANDDDTNTPHEAELNLNVGSNTLSVTVTAADRITTKTYTITVNRTAPPPAPTDCPADTDWCTTMKVGYQTIPAPGFTTEQFGFLAAANFGDLGSTTFTHARTSYTVSEIYRIKSTRESDNVVQVDQLSIQTSTTLPDGTVLKLGSRTFTVDTDSETTILGQEQWNLRADPPVWTSGQNVTVSLKLPSTTATLSALTVNDGTSDLTLTPTFEYARYAYEADVVNAITTVTLTATLNHDTDEITSVTLGGTAIADTNFTDGITVPLLVAGTNQIVITVTDPDTSTTKTYTVTVTRGPDPFPIETTDVPDDWGLIPSGLGVGDEFRLIFLSSTKQDARSTDIADYNTFIQSLAANGHPDIQAYSSGFTVVGCTDDDNARDNTSTRHNSSGRGVPIYWLNGNKVADDYQDFYDGSWDDERNDKNASGTNGPNTNLPENYPFTGCKQNGTKDSATGNSVALGNTNVVLGTPDTPVSGNGPLNSNAYTSKTTERPFYGLSEVFKVFKEPDATLSDLTIERTTGSENITLSPAFDADTFTYTATAHHRIDAVTLTATKTDSLATVVITGDDTSTPNTADLDLSVGTNTLSVTVTAEDTSTTLTYTITVTRERDPKEPVNVPPEWSLIPRGLNVGDQFRLLFLTGTRRDGSSPVIGDYNTFVRARAAAGHTDIQEHSDRFTVVGCTEDTDARNNTGTRYSNANKGVPIYWLDGTNVADDYEDFYDGSWDDEANDKNEDGNDAHNTSNDANYPLTGCSDDGTERISASVSSALGNGGDVTIARPDSSNSNHGPLSSNGTITNTFTRPMYGISPVFLVAVTNDATLRSLAIETTTGGETVNLTPPFVPSTSTYTAEVPNETDAVKLTAAANNSNSTVAITGDTDINTLNEAVFDLVVGDNTLTLTVTAEDGNTLTYTITVTRADVTRNTATLKAATGQNVPLSPAFATGTYTYTATVANRIETVKLEAATNESNSTIAITGDDDTNTPDEAEFDLNTGGANIITFTVTPEDSPAVTYTITVTRGEAPPEPTDCPAVNDWCATLKVGYDSDISSTVTDEYWGYETRQSYGDLTSTTFTYDAIEYTVTDLYRYRNSDSFDNTVLGEWLNLVVSPSLPDSTALQVGTRTFTTGTDSFTGTIGIEEWNIKGAPLDWTSNQNVTVSLTFPRAPILPWDGQTVHDVKQRQTHTISNAGDSVWFSAADLKENGLYQFIYYDAAQEQSVADRTIKLYSPDGNPVVHHGYTLVSDGQTPTFQVIPDEDGTYYLQVSSTTNDTGQFWIFYADRSLRSPKGDRSGTTLQKDCGGGLNTACRLFEPDSAVQGHLKADDLDNFRFALRKGGETRVCANFLDNPLSDVTWTDGNAPASENLQFSVGSPNSKWPRLYIEEAGLNCTQYFTPTFTGLYDVYVSLLTSLGPTECSTCDPPRPSNPYRDDLAAHPNQHDDYEVWFEVRGAR